MPETKNRPYRRHQANHIVVFAVCLASGLPEFAVAGLIDCVEPSYGWTATPDSDDQESVRGLVADGDRNIIICGTFSGIVDLDPTDGEDWRTATADDDAFVTKLAPNGAYLWSAVIGGDGYESGLAVAVDSAGNVLSVDISWGRRILIPVQERISGPPDPTSTDT